MAVRTVAAEGWPGAGPEGVTDTVMRVATTATARAGSPASTSRRRVTRRVRAGSRRAPRMLASIAAASGEWGEGRYPGSGRADRNAVSRSSSAGVITAPPWDRDRHRVPVSSCHDVARQDPGPDGPRAWPVPGAAGTAPRLGRNPARPRPRPG